LGRLPFLPHLYLDGVGCGIGVVAASLARGTGDAGDRLRAVGAEHGGDADAERHAAGKRRDETDKHADGRPRLDRRRQSPRTTETQQPDASHGPSGTSFLSALSQMIDEPPIHVSSSAT
jgi:hypothetical protein